MLCDGPKTVFAAIDSALIQSILAVSLFARVTEYCSIKKPCLIFTAFTKELLHHALLCAVCVVF